MHLRDINTNKRYVKSTLVEHYQASVPLYKAEFEYQSPEYLELFRKARRSGRTFDWETMEMLRTRLGESVKLSTGEHVLLDCPYVTESIVIEGPGLIRKIAAALGVAAAVWAGGEITSAERTPLGKAMQQAASEGDQIARKHLDNLDFYAEENPAMLIKLSNKYLHKSESISESATEKTYHVYTLNPKTRKVHKIMFGTEHTLAESQKPNRDVCAQNIDPLKPGYWRARAHRYIRESN